MENQEHNELDVVQENVPAENSESQLHIDLSQIVEHASHREEEKETLPLDTVWDEEFFKSIGLDLPEPEEEPTEQAEEEPAEEAPAEEQEGTYGEPEQSPAETEKKKDPWQKSILLISPIQYFV